MAFVVISFFYMILQIFNPLFSLLFNVDIKEGHWFVHKQRSLNLNLCGMFLMPFCTPEVRTRALALALRILYVWQFIAVLFLFGFI